MTTYARKHFLTVNESVVSVTLGVSQHRKESKSTATLSGAHSENTDCVDCDTGDSSCEFSSNKSIFYVMKWEKFFFSFSDLVLTLLKK